jgi:hypothetical protein
MKFWNESSLYIPNYKHFSIALTTRYVKKTEGMNSVDYNKF